MKRMTDTEMADHIASNWIGKKVVRAFAGEGSRGIAEVVVEFEGGTRSYLYFERDEPVAVSTAATNPDKGSPAEGVAA